MATWKLIRDTVLLGVAVFMFIYLTVRPPGDAAVAAAFLAAALALAGTPAALRLDERIRRNGDS
jgi:hypothetical protein